MTDYTSQIIEAQDARYRMQSAKKQIKLDVRRKYEAQMRRDEAEAVADAELEFARTLARIHASGVPQALIRREVLRTNVWGTWTYWRDLAAIEPERVSVSNAKEARAKANLAYEWDMTDPDNPILIWRKDHVGNLFAKPYYFIDVIANTEADRYGIHQYAEVADRAWDELPNKGSDLFFKEIPPVVKAAFQSGQIPERVGYYELLRQRVITMEQFEETAKQSERMNNGG